MYFDFPTYFKIIRLVITDKPSPRRWMAHFSLLLLLSLWAFVNTVCLALDRLFFPGYRKVRIESPVFIVGNARSGTTLFHRLLCGDEERFVYFRTWEILFPSLLQKKLILALVAVFRRSFPRSFERLVAWEERQLQTLKAMHPIGINKPEEDEFLLLIPFASATLTVLFPYADRLTELADFDSRPAPVRKKIMQVYRECVARQLYLHGGGRTLVSKNPTFVSKLRSLAGEFPDAKFVYLIRNPFETIPSLLKLMRTVWEGLGLDSGHIEGSTQQLAEGCMRDYTYAMEVLAELPADRVAIVEYTELIADLKATVERVYEQIGLSISPAFEEHLAAEGSRQKRHQSSNVYTLEEFGISEDDVTRKLGPILQRFGFRPEDVPRDRTIEAL
jgi:hypothetical protein